MNIIALSIGLLQISTFSQCLICLTPMLICVLNSDFMSLDTNFLLRKAWYSTALWRSDLMRASNKLCAAQ